LGFGSDVGGSIRVPAHFNGIVGFKPTQGRLSIALSHVAKISEVELLAPHFPPAPGPLARSVNDAIEVFKIQCDGKARYHDPFLSTKVFD